MAQALIVSDPKIMMGKPTLAGTGHEVSRPRRAIVEGRGATFTAAMSRVPNLSTNFLLIAPNIIVLDPPKGRTRPRFGSCWNDCPCASRMARTVYSRLRSQSWRPATQIRISSSLLAERKLLPDEYRKKLKLRGETGPPRSGALRCGRRRRRIPADCAAEQSEHPGLLDYPGGLPRRQQPTFPVAPPQREKP